MTNNNGDTCGLQPVGSSEDVFQERLARDLMEHLGQIRFHSGALASGQHDYVEIIHALIPEAVRYSCRCGITSWWLCRPAVSEFGTRQPAPPPRRVRNSLQYRSLTQIYRAARRHSPGQERSATRVF